MHGQQNIKISYKLEGISAIALTDAKKFKIQACSTGGRVTW